MKYFSSIIHDRHITYTLYDIAPNIERETFIDINTIDKSDIFSHHTRNGNFIAHNFYIILCISNGRGYIKSNFQSFDIKENTAYFLSPKNICSFLLGKETNGIIICITDEFLSNLNTNILKRLKYNGFCPTESISSCNIPNGILEKLIQDINNIKVCNNKTFISSFLKAAYTYSLFTIFLVDIFNECKWNDCDTMFFTTNSYNTFLDFIELIEKNYTRWHNVQDYIKELRISQTSLRQYTKRYTGMTPLKIINKRIILEAKRMIHNNFYSIKEISIELGFENSYYFGKFFKQETAMTPTEYRDAFVEKRS